MTKKQAEYDQNNAIEERILRCQIGISNDDDDQKEHLWGAGKGQRVREHSLIENYGGQML